MAATEQCDHLTNQGTHTLKKKRFKLCLKINNTKCMATLYAGNHLEVRAVFLVILYQMLNSLRASTTVTSKTERQPADSLLS